MLGPLKIWLRALRVKQWTKNAVVLAAFLFGLGDRQQKISWGSGWIALQAALLFSLASSAVYLINDIRDLPLDRRHPKKRLRPLAAGEITVGAAWSMAAVLLMVSGIGSWAISRNFFWVVMGYVAMQIVYSWALKRVVLLDIFVIAFGFVLRALAGAVAVNVAISPWLLLCALLLALFLALCKRRHEKIMLEDLALETRESLAHYHPDVLDQLIAVVSSATLVCYALYTLWPETVQKFGTHRLGLTIPFVIFGLFRYLDLVYRHEKGDRPEQILLTDGPLLINLVLYGITVLIILAGARQ